MRRAISLKCLWDVLHDSKTDYGYTIRATDPENEHFAYFDLLDKEGNILCMDGETVSVSYDSQKDAFVCKNENGEEDDEFFLSQKEAKYVFFEPNTQTFSDLIARLRNYDGPVVYEDADGMHIEQTACDLCEEAAAAIETLLQEKKYLLIVTTNGCLEETRIFSSEEKMARVFEEKTGWTYSEYEDFVDFDNGFLGKENPHPDGWDFSDPDTFIRCYEIQEE